MDVNVESLYYEPLEIKNARKLIKISADEKKNELVIWMLNERGKRITVAISMEKDSLEITTDLFRTPGCFIEAFNMQPQIRQGNDASQVPGLGKIKIQLG